MIDLKGLLIIIMALFPVILYSGSIEDIDKKYWKVVRVILSITVVFMAIELTKEFTTWI